MNVDSLLQWFMPKEARFRDLLAEDTANLAKGVSVFVEIANSASLEDRRVKTVYLKSIEHAGDQITRRIFEALNSTFITPLDREDIRALASNLDDILDHLEGVAQYLVLFQLADAPEALRHFARILQEMVTEIQRATNLIWDLSNQAEIQQAMVAISELENQGDALYGAIIAELFKKTHTDAIQVMKWKEVYDGLESACDGCKEYTHVIGNVVIKNA